MDVGDRCVVGGNGCVVGEDYKSVLTGFSMCAGPDGTAGFAQRAVTPC